VGFGRIDFVENCSVGIRGIGFVYFAGIVVEIVVGTVVVAAVAGRIVVAVGIGCCLLTAAGMLKIVAYLLADFAESEAAEIVFFQANTQIDNVVVAAAVVAVPSALRESNKPIVGAAALVERIVVAKIVAADLPMCDE
jgi:hypothetical protein